MINSPDNRNLIINNHRETNFSHVDLPQKKNILTIVSSKLLDYCQLLTAYLPSLSTVKVTAKTVYTEAASFATKQLHVAVSKTNQFYDFCKPYFDFIGEKFSAHAIAAIQKNSDIHEHKGGIGSYPLTAQKGKFFGTLHSVGEHAWEEKVERQDAVSDHTSILSKTLERIEKRNPPPNSPLGYQLAFCRQERENAQNLNKNFITSNHSRDVLSANEKIDFTEASSKICQGVPVNFRYHTSQAGGSHFRSGVFSFPSNGHTNLEELRKLQKDDNLRVEKQAQLRAKMEKLQKQKNPENQRKIASLNHAIAELEIAQLPKTIAQREMAIKMQFLHLVQGQIKKNPDKIQGGAFQLAHLSLLNQHKDNLDRTGWAHIEANAIRDMKAIFNQFQGEKIIIDRKGPFIDADGKLHVAPPAGRKDLREGQEIQLATYFMNVSVQGHTRNDGLQAEFNEGVISSFIDRANDSPEAKALLIKAREKLRAGDSNYAIAEDIGYALSKLGLPFSISCQSGKDRTGFVSGRIILRHLFDKVDKDVKADPKKKRHIKHDMGVSLLNEDGCLNRICQDNNAHFVKCSPLSLPGYNENIQGFATRLHYLIFKQAKGLASTLLA